MFIPIGDDNSARRLTPVVVYLLIATNVVVWLLQLTMGDRFTMGYSTIPYEITARLVEDGVRFVTVYYTSSDTQPWDTHTNHDERHKKLCADADFDLKRYPRVIEWVERVKGQPRYVPMLA